MLSIILSITKFFPIFFMNSRFKPGAAGHGRANASLADPVVYLLPKSVTLVSNCNWEVFVKNLQCSLKFIEFDSTLIILWDSDKLI